MASSDKPYVDMSEDELEAELEQALDEHESGTNRAKRLGDEALRTTPTVPITLRVPAPLLARVKEEAARRGTPYQRLMRVLMESALDQELPEVIRVPVSAATLQRAQSSGSLLIAVSSRQR